MNQSLEFVKMVSVEVPAVHISWDSSGNSSTHPSVATISGVFEDLRKEDKWQDLWQNAIQKNRVGGHIQREIDKNS